MRGSNNGGGVRPHLLAPYYFLPTDRPSPRLMTARTPHDQTDDVLNVQRPVVAAPPAASAPPLAHPHPNHPKPKSPERARAALAKKHVCLLYEAN